MMSQQAVQPPDYSRNRRKKCNVSVIQQRLRQALTQLNNYTYNVEDTELMQKTLVFIQHHLTQFRAKCTIRQSAAAFRLNHRLVRRKISAALLRKRLAGIRAKRQNKKLVYLVLREMTSNFCLVVKPRHHFGAFIKRRQLLDRE